MSSHRYPSGAPAVKPGEPGSLSHHYDPGIPPDALRLPGGRRVVARIPPIRPDHPTREEEQNR